MRSHRRVGDLERLLVGIEFDSYTVG